MATVGWSGAEGRLAARQRPLKLHPGALQVPKGLQHVAEVAAPDGHGRVVGGQASHPMTVEVGAVRWIAAVPLPEPIWVRTEGQEPAMTHFGREPVMATSSSEPSMAAVIRRREYGELVEEPVAPPG
jgi:hypothetical protein